MKKRCIIFGASKSGKVAYRLLGKEYEIIGFSDNDSKKWGTQFCNCEVFSPDSLIQKKETKIIIASVYYALIHKQLRELGINDIEVFFYRGISADNDSDEYELFELSDTGLFELSRFDANKVKKVSGDFSENYLPGQSVEKHSLKNSARKKVLFCAYIFPPIGGAGVQRSLKFVKYLRKNGFEPIVLTVGKNDGKLVNDESLLSELPEDLTVIRIDNMVYLPESLSIEEQQEIFNLYCGVMKSEDWMNKYLDVIRSTDARLIPDNKLIWVNECLKQIEQKIDMHEIDIVYTTGSPFSTFFLGFYIKNKYGIKWVQDYRDPWMSSQYYLDNYYQSDKATFHLQKQLEKELIQTADMIVVIGENFKGDFTKHYGIPSKRLIEITNGYDEEDFNTIKEQKRNEKFVLCYNGTVYIDRDPTKLLDMINELIEERKIEADDIQWIFNGSIEERWKIILEKKDRYGIVIYNGYLSHSDSIKSAMDANMLILFGVAVGYTGKVFEYLRMKKPILSLSPEKGVLDGLLDYTRTGENFVYDDIENIKKFILQHYRNWKREEYVFEVNDDAVKEYSREYLTKRLADVFNMVLEENWQ